MLLVAMQPTYLPWMGYFDLIDQCELFVFLDSLQFEKQSWQQRNRIKTHQGPLWLTLPVHQALGQSVLDVRLTGNSGWRRKHWTSLEMSYRQAPFWPMYSEQLREIYAREWDSLAELNIHIIEVLCAMLGIVGRFVRSSSLKVDGRKAELLVNLCNLLGAGAYLSPAGSFSYLQNDTLFEQSGRSVVFQDYAHPRYSQLHGPFLPYLSVLDLLFNAGPDALRILRSGRRSNLNMVEMSVRANSRINASNLSLQN